MKKSDQAPIRHHDDPELFRAALAYTAAETGFAARLIEKDYFCTVLLSYLATLSTELAFKGGTCLAKVHTDFYRMSEDLDFVISSPCHASRKERSSRVAGLRKGIEELPGHLHVFGVNKPLTGVNDSKQYLAGIGYSSLDTGMEETIKLEVSLREPLLTSSSDAQARTILLNPFTAKPYVAPVIITCLSLLESFAEKFRAALSRRDPAFEISLILTTPREGSTSMSRSLAWLNWSVRRWQFPVTSLRMFQPPEWTCSAGRSSLNSNQCFGKKILRSSTWIVLLQL